MKTNYYICIMSEEGKIEAVEIEGTQYNIPEFAIGYHKEKGKFIFDEMVTGCAIVTAKTLKEGKEKMAYFETKEGRKLLKDHIFKQSKTEEFKAFYEDCQRKNRVSMGLNV